MAAQLRLSPLRPSPKLAATTLQREAACKRHFPSIAGGGGGGGWRPVQLPVRSLRRGRRGGRCRTCGGDLLTKTLKLVKGLARPEPRWLKAMQEALPVTFPRADGKINKIEFPEDVYVRKFNKKHPDSLYHDAIKISGFDPPPARVFAWRVLELKEQGVSEDDAMAVADMEYRMQKKAYKELKEIACSERKKLPPNPYPSAIKEIQAEEKKYVMDRLFNPKVIEIANKMKEERDKLLKDRAA